ncbi:MAG: ABC transporter permease [Clostridia bacterium]|nr:ABC transporter permease [Clostridia bacterium]MBQ2348747.1 ABC transporter permease [Clostridia bacterium]
MSRFVKDFKKFLNYTVFSSKAELKSEVADSFLSWLWWILDPLLYMLVYLFIAVVVFNSKVPYFPVFVFVGLNTWSFFSKTLKSSVKLVSAKKMIVTKVYVPKYMFVFEKMGVYGFKMLVSNALVVITMIAYKVPVTWRVVWIIPITLVLCVVTFGLSTIVMHFGVFVEDLLNVITVVLQMGFYLSGIFYSIEPIGEVVPGRVPVPYDNLLVKLNPMALIITDLRRVTLYGQDPHWVMLCIWFFAGLVVSIIGVKMIYKFENSYVKVI